MAADSRIWNVEKARLAPPSIAISGDELFGAALDDVGRLQEERLPGSRRHARPGGKCGSGRGDGGFGIRWGPGGGLSDEFIVQRVVDGESRPGVRPSTPR